MIHNYGDEAVQALQFWAAARQVLLVRAFHRREKILASPRNRRQLMKLLD